jgi:hypothetical protein
VAESSSKHVALVILAVSSRHDTRWLEQLKHSHGPAPAAPDLTIRWIRPGRLTNCRAGEATSTAAPTAGCRVASASASPRQAVTTQRPRHPLLPRIEQPHHDAAGRARAHETSRDGPNCPEVAPRRPGRRVHDGARARTGKALFLPSHGMQMQRGVVSVFLEMPN